MWSPERVRALQRLALTVPVVVVSGLLVGAIEQPRGLAEAFVVSDSSSFGRMRVFGTTGDPGIKTRWATAIVRKRDGALVDFWPAKPALPTTAQLGSSPNIDGLWLFESSIVVDDKDYRLETNDVHDAVDHVETTTVLTIGANRVTAHNEFRLAADAPRLLVTTRIVHDSGPGPLHFELADEVRWGNVISYAAGVGALPYEFSGSAKWVGRKGASGDLVLRATDGRDLEITTIADHPGFRPPLHVAYGHHALLPGQSLEIERVLAYEPIALPPPPRETATLRAQIVDELGKALACKLTLRGIDGTPDPDFGDEGNETGANRFVWSGNGRFNRPIRPGHYTVLATAGPERDARRWTVQIDENEVEELQGSLPRVVPTPGWIAADLHLHQAPSIDADIGLSTRVIAVAAEGLEFAVATDHYFVTDLGPTVRWLTRAKALSRPLITMAGTEVSTTGNRFGHFNLYPAPLDSHIEYHYTTPSRLFESMRNASPNGIVQVNHPRWTAIGYFQTFHMDSETGDIPADKRNEYSDNFDAVEVYNGLDIGTEQGILKVFDDWRHLLGKGHHYTATGNSDSHKLFFIDPGVPRTMIFVGGTDDEADVRVDPEAAVAAVRAGHVMVTSGPFVEASIAGAGPGDTARIAGKFVDVDVRVRAAPWIDVSEVAVYVGAEKRPAVVRPVAPSTAVLRFDGKLRLQAPSDTFVVVLARGETPLPNVYSKHAKPLAFTNPIWIKHAR